MRAIKFRAFEEINRVMHNDFRFIKSGEDGNDWVVFVSDRQTLKDKHHPLDNPWFQAQFKIMQFTGLHDKNGVEIYEGDIIACWGSILKIVWNESDASFFADSSDESIYESGQEWGGNCTVIGNIHETPELLK